MWDIDESGRQDVAATREDLLHTIGGRVAKGQWFNAANSRYPTVVLGARAAQLLGVDGPNRQVWIGERWFTVIGVLAPVPPAPEVDLSAPVGRQAAREVLGFDGHPTLAWAARGRQPGVSRPLVVSELTRSRAVGSNGRPLRWATRAASRCGPSGTQSRSTCFEPNATTAAIRPKVLPLMCAGCLEGPGGSKAPTRSVASRKGTR